ncbi:MAG: hypothetical protein AAGA40_03780 [Cyanobacteria bacterium P01_E01_bin.45]
MTEINCAEACVNGCVLGNDCPHLEERKKASAFIQETSLDAMLQMAEARLERLRNEHTAKQ